MEVELVASEVQMGFEPTYVGFANRCLTTWLLHQHSKKEGPNMPHQEEFAKVDHFARILFRALTCDSPHRCE